MTRLDKIDAHSCRCARGRERSVAQLAAHLFGIASRVELDVGAAFATTTATRRRAPRPTVTIDRRRRRSQPDHFEFRARTACVSECASNRTLQIAETCLGFETTDPQASSWDWSTIANLDLVRVDVFTIGAMLCFECHVQIVEFHERVRLFRAIV